MEIKSFRGKTAMLSTEIMEKNEQLGNVRPRRGAVPCPMVRKTIFFVSFILFLIGGVYMVIIPNKSPEIKSFELSDYQYYIENFASEENVGPIIDAKDAVNKAEQIWIKLYGKAIKKEKPYQVFLDDKNDIWLVQGTLRANMMGGVANCIVESGTGKVLAVWHGK